MAAADKHLDVPAGTAVRFEPGETRQVTLVDNARTDLSASVRTAAQIAETFDRASGARMEDDR